MKFLLSLFLSIVLVSSTYNPKKAPCPGGRLVREAKGLSKQESDWIENKAKSEYLKNFLEGAHLDDFDAESFLENAAKDHRVSVGLAFSGGGNRAMLCGAGFISALDNRTEGAHEKALGGLLQSSDYISGLSGGSWLLGSLVMNNFTSVQDILDNKTKIWDLTYSIFDSKGSGAFDLIKYYLSLAADVLLKKMAGFQCTLTDIWGRALSHHFFGGVHYGDDLIWSDVQHMPAFTNHEMPFPIIIANAVLYGNRNATAESPIIEISPFEMGSWDKDLNSFTQTRYLGTNTTNGNPVDTDCINGYDNAGFVLGTSSTLFNEIFGTEVQGRLDHTQFNSTVQNELKSIFDGSPVDHFIAAYEPNPFKDVTEAHNKSYTETDILELVDGGEDHQNIPLYPLVQKARGVDVIFAFDSSADTAKDWPDGGAMYQAYKRQFNEQGISMSVPKIPDSGTFIKEGLTSKPVFFGCDATVPSALTSGESNNSGSGNLTQATGEEKVPPLIVYIANRKISYDSNKSTFTFVYQEDEKRGMIQNGFDVASRHSGEEDKQWKVCVSCAIIKREQDRKGIEQTEQCKKCFEQYCWKG